MLKLSQIVPVYNPGPVFEKCLKSLRDQALKDSEIIIVFDGASEQGAATVEKVFGRDSRVKVLTIEHGGACAARQAGIDASGGDIIQCFDADCIIEPGASKAWMQIFEDRPGVQFIYSAYKFMDHSAAINTEMWDPFLLRIRNYISTCFPVRRAVAGKWDTSLESLQDWDFWLQVLENCEKAGLDISKVGLHQKGYAFATALPSADSISGKGCTNEVWLDRVKKVKAKHGLKDSDVCVTSVEHKYEGISLAKTLACDYQDAPNDKPNEYKTIVQVGFPLIGKFGMQASANFMATKKNVLFWTASDLFALYHKTAFETIEKYVETLNGCAKQYCEDDRSRKMLERLGFKVEVYPLPVSGIEVKPMPEKVKWAIDCSPEYAKVAHAAILAMPDFEIVNLEAADLYELRGLIHFHKDKSLTTPVRKAHLAGRHVVSNIQEPYCGYLDDTNTQEKLLRDLVNRVRSLRDKSVKTEATEHYKTDPAKVLEVVR